MVKQSHYKPGQALRDPGCWSSRFKDSRNRKAVRLSALLTGRLYASGNIPGTQYSAIRYVKNTIIIYFLIYKLGY